MLVIKNLLCNISNIVIYNVKCKNYDNPGKNYIFPKLSGYVSRDLLIFNICFPVAAGEM